MSDRQVRVVISAVDRGAGKSLTDIGDKGEKSAHRISGAFSKLGGLIGGEVGSAIQEASDKMEHFGKGNRLAATGAAVAGLGGILAVMGSKEQAAAQQLDQAIANSGHTAEEYGSRIEETVGHMEHFGHTAVETKNSLATLTNATHDPKKALDLMGEAADLAASRHISLQTAAMQLGKVVGGSGARTLKLYGIEIVKNADGTKNWTATNEKLAQVLHGQASAAADTFSGKLKALRTEVEDNVAEFGQKYGPAILAAGVAMSALKPLASGVGSAVGALKGVFTSTAVAAETSSLAMQLSEAQAAAAVAVSEAAKADAAAESAVAIAASVEGTSSVLATGATAAAESAIEFAAAMQVEADAAIAAAAEIETAATAVGVAEVEVGAATSTAFGPVGIAIGAVVGVGALAAGALGLFGGAAKKQIKPTDDFTQAIIRDNDALGENTRKVVKNRLQKDGLYDAGLKLGIGQKTLTDAMMGNKSALAEVAGKMHAGELAGVGYYGMSDKVAKKVREQKLASDKLKNGIGDLTETLKVNQHAAGNLEAADGKVKKGFDATAGSAKYTANQLADLALNGHLTSAQLAKLEKQKRINVNGKDAKQTLADVRSYLDGIQSKTVTVSVLENLGRTSFQPTIVRHNAGGSDFFPGGRSVVAEREAEIIAPRGASITPLSRMGGGSTHQYSITIQVPQVWTGNSHELGRVVAGVLEQYAGAGGKLRIARAVN